MALRRVRQLCRRDRQRGLLGGDRADGLFRRLYRRWFDLARPGDGPCAQSALRRTGTAPKLCAGSMGDGSRVGRRPVVVRLRRRLWSADRASRRPRIRTFRAAVAWRRLSRPQSCRAHTGLEPGAADSSHAARWPAVDARQPAPRRHAGRRRPGRAFLRYNAPLAKAESSVRRDRDDHQFADGFRHSLDHDAWGPGRSDDGTILARLPHGLPVPAVRRRGEPPLFPHGAELPLGDRLRRGVPRAAQSSAAHLRGRR